MFFGAKEKGPAVSGLEQLRARAHILNKCGGICFLARECSTHASDVDDFHAHR